jgi:uncharacterized membrane protein YecN with MAPEG domain
MRAGEDQAVILPRLLYRRMQGYDQGMELPVTTAYAALLGLLLIVLSDLVSRSRKKSRVSMGHGDDPMLERTMRAHGNFVEYVPLGLILLLVMEVGGAEAWVLHLFGLMLLGGRLLHALGMIRPDGVISGRYWGTALTWLMILGASLFNLWLLAR